MNELPGYRPAKIIEVLQARSTLFGEHLSVARRLALNLLRQDYMPGRSIKRKQRRAGLRYQLLEKLTEILMRQPCELGSHGLTEAARGTRDQDGRSVLTR